MAKKVKATTAAEQSYITNSLTDLISLMSQGTGLYAPVSSTDTFQYNNRWYILSNNRALLTEMYIEQGIVQTLTDQPVDDAFRAGFDIKADQLSADEIEKLQAYCDEYRVIESIMQAIKWARLYGGGAILIATNQRPDTPLNMNAINDKSPLSFIAVDEWELNFTQANLPEAMLPDMIQPFYDYYGITVHGSRVLPIRGKQAPSLRRPQFRGWGMSALEPIVRSFNQYLKYQDVLFELLDEAKVDIYKIKGFTQTLMTANGTAGVSKRIQLANTLKNYNNALTMDSEDDYDQKQIAFTGLAEIMKEIRIQVACDLKMPVTKLFGVSSAGFNSGEDDIENYNSMIEGEIRSKSKYIVIQVLKICCQRLFGMVPDDLTINWKPLRILSAEQEENVKEKKFNRVKETFASGLMTDLEAKSAINKDSLLPIEIDETIEAQLTMGEDEDFTVDKETIV